MQAEVIRRAAELFVEARRSGTKLPPLSAELQPGSVNEALAIQDETVRLLRESVPAWKVNITASGDVFRGALLRSRVFESPARIPVGLAPMLGVEAEIAFRFESDLPPRPTAYTYDEVAAVVTAFVAIEVLDSRFDNYKDAPQLSKIADCVSNGAFVIGGHQPDWRNFDLTKLSATVSVDGEVIVRRVGGNPIGDPLLLVIAFAEMTRHRAGVLAGTMVTTGSHTGITYPNPDQVVMVSFEDFGSAEVSFIA